MTTINGLTITDGLVAAIKHECCSQVTDETMLDSYEQWLMQTNDYLLDRLTEACPDNIDELKELSTLLVNSKAIRDMITRLNTELKISINTK